MHPAIVNVLHVRQENMALLLAVIDHPDNKPSDEEEAEQEAPLGIQVEGTDDNTPSVNILLEAIQGSSQEDSGQTVLESAVIKTEDKRSLEQL